MGEKEFSRSIYPAIEPFSIGFLEVSRDKVLVFRFADVGKLLGEREIEGDGAVAGGGAGGCFGVTKSPFDGEDALWYICKVPLGVNEFAASIPHKEISGKGERLHALFTGGEDSLGSKRVLVELEHGSLSKDEAVLVSSIVEDDETDSEALFVGGFREMGGHGSFDNGENGVCRRKIFVEMDFIGVVQQLRGEDPVVQPLVDLPSWNR
ncbi:hypothetical protein Droror1_Dr00020250 [Drosera rotundifolia]